MASAGSDCGNEDGDDGNNSDVKNNARDLATYLRRDQT